jgi:hypothetical protein
VKLPGEGQFLDQSRDLAPEFGRDRCGGRLRVLEDIVEDGGTEDFGVGDAEVARQPAKNRDRVSDVRSSTILP